MPKEDSACCGLPLKRWAMVSSIICSIYFLGLSIAGFWCYSYLTTQETATSAEGNEEGIWNNARWSSLGFAISFLVVAILSVYVFFLAGYRPTTSPHTLTFVWIAMMIIGGGIVVGAAAGELTSFSEETLGRIEKACKTIDEFCFPNYEKLEWWSIITKSVGMFVLIWMLVSVGIYRSHLRSNGAVGGQQAVGDDQEKLLEDVPKSLGRSSSRRKKERREKRAIVEKSLSRKGGSRSDSRSGRSESRGGRTRARSISSSSSDGSSSEGRVSRRRSKSRSRSRK